MKLIILTIAFISACASVDAYWAYNGSYQLFCGAVTPGPRQPCYCFWVTDENGKIPGSESCEVSDNDQAGGCERPMDCFNKPV